MPRLRTACPASAEIGAGQHEFARRVRETLTIPVDCPSRIADGTVQRFLKWHLSHPG